MSALHVEPWNCKNVCLWNLQQQQQPGLAAALISAACHSFLTPSTDVLSPTYGIAGLQALLQTVIPHAAVVLMPLPAQ